MNQDCCICGVDICLSDSMYHELRRTRASFYCPAGHSQQFTGGCEHEQTARRQREAREHYERESRRCPWPTCRVYVYSSRDSLYHHMQRAHGMPTLAAVREEEEAS